MVEPGSLKGIFEGQPIHQLRERLPPFVDASECADSTNNELRQRIVQKITELFPAPQTCDS